MARTLNAGAQVTEIDPQSYPDGVVRLRRRGEANDFLQIHADGTIWSGNGTASPSPVAGATPTMVATQNGGDFAAATTASSAGNSTVTAVSSGAASGSANLEALSGAGQAVLQLQATVDGHATAAASLNTRNMWSATDDGAALSLSVYDAAPVARHASIAHATDAGTAITQLNTLIDAVKAFGITL